MGKSRWRFINAADPTQIVVVSDRLSAEVMGRIFRGEIKGPWSMQVEDEREPVVKPAQRRGSRSMEMQSAEDSQTIENQVSAPAAEAPHHPDGHEAEMPPGKRKFPRFKIRLLVVVTYGVHSFNSATRDVSIGGMQLEEKIPQFMFGQYCRIQIYRSTAAERIDLRCKIFADPRNPRRLQFIDPAPEVTERLKGWIDLLRAESEKTVA